MFAMSIAAMADEVPGITVAYVDKGSAAYIQAISAIGKLKFEAKDGVKHAFVEFKNTELADVDLGAIAGINRISFGKIDEGDITDIENVMTDSAIKITVYPNPVADHLHVEGIAEGEIIRIFSFDGRLVKVTTDAEIYMGDMSNGVYILQVGKAVAKIFKN